MLVLEFAGYFVYRLPTDPDPTDEARGVSGYTFALAGEPDLDRIIRFKDLGGFVPRSGSPPLGVKVVRARRTLAHGKTVPVPELEGAVVDLLGDPMLENRNWLLTLPGMEPIVPFRLEIARAGGVRIYREDWLRAGFPDLPVVDATADELKRRGASGIALDPLAIGQATGMWDPLQAIAERREALVKERESTRDPVALAALGTRIRELELALTPDFARDRRVLARQAIERFQFDLNGPDPCVDGAGALGFTLDGSVPWPLAFWMGAWDCDTLTAFVSGALRIPIAASPAS